MKRLLLAAFLGAVLGNVTQAIASSIKSWSNGEILSSTDLNSNFSHIHNTMVGGHGARLVNADVSATAAIAHSKLATPALVPRAFGHIPVCTSDPCSITRTSGVSAVNWSAEGVYSVTLSSTRNSTYAVVVSGGQAAAGFSLTNTPICYTKIDSTTIFSIYCVENDTGAGEDTPLNFVVFDT